MYVFDVLIIGDIISVGIDAHPGVVWGFLAAYTFEILAYVYTYGPQKHFDKNMNK